MLKDKFKDILLKQMKAELNASLRYDKYQKEDWQTDKKRNGHSSKNVKSQYGKFQLEVPGDRNGEFIPKFIPKYQRDISEIKNKVLSLDGRGKNTWDIHNKLQDLYGIYMSAEKKCIILYSLVNTLSRKTIR